MKKLSLSALAFQKGEVLTRSQLKKILGGTGSGDSGTGSGGTTEECADGCTSSAQCGSHQLCSTTSCTKKDKTVVSQYFCMADPNS